jgi:hypothetical protein
MLRDDALDCTLFCFRLIDTLIKHQRDLRLTAHKFELPLIVVHVARLRIPIGHCSRAHQFGNDVADARIRRKIGFPLGPYAHFGAAVAAEHRPVLNKRDRQTIPRRRNRGCRSGDAAAHDYEIKFAAIGRFIRPAQKLRPQRVELLSLIRWNKLVVARK